MKTDAPSLPPPFPAGSSSEAAPFCWHLQLSAAREPLLLARILQKLAVPEIELLAVRFETSAGSDARAELEFIARPERARLAAARLRGIVGVHGVGLRLLA